MLWLHGGPGIGKTFLSASIIEYLCQNSSRATAFHFCSHDDPSNRQPFSVLRSWIYQLIAKKDQAYEAALKHKPDTGDAVPSVLWRIFGKILAELGACHLVVDGFDECLDYDRTGREGAREKFLARLLRETRSTRANILIVSRNLDLIRSGLDAAKPTEGTHAHTVSDYAITMNDTAQDIKSVSRTITQSRIRDPARRDKISEQLSTGCQGMFLWLRLEGERMKPGMRDASVERILNSTPPGLSHAYERNLVEISKVDGEGRNRAQDIFRWMLFGFRPLSVLELLHAIEVMNYQENADLNPIHGINDDLINAEILASCGSLVEVRRGPDPQHAAQDRTVHFVHFSAKEFLLNAGKQCEDNRITQLFAPDPGSDHGALHRACISYLLLSSTPTMPAEIVWPFSDYCTKHWADHFHESIGDSRAACVILQRELFVPGEAFDIWAGKTYRANFQLHEERWTIPRGSEILPLHVACRYNLPELCTELLEECDKVPDNALLIAVFHGNGAIVRLLLGRGDVDLNAGIVPALTIASYQGHGAIVKQLLENPQVNINLDSDGSGTPLYIASQRGHVDVVQQLLERKDVQVNLLDRFNGATPLHAATVWCKKDIVQLLLGRKDVLVNALDKKRCTPLDIALKLGFPDITRRIRRKGGQRGYEVGNGPAIILHGVGADKAQQQGGHSSLTLHAGRTGANKEVGRRLSTTRHGFGTLGTHDMRERRSIIGHGIRRARTIEVGAQQPAGINGIVTPSDYSDLPPLPPKPAAYDRGRRRLHRSTSERSRHMPPPRPASDVSPSRNGMHYRQHSPAYQHGGAHSSPTVHFPPTGRHVYPKASPQYYSSTNGGLPAVSPWFPRDRSGVVPPDGTIFHNTTPWFPSETSGILPPGGTIFPDATPWFPPEISGALPPESVILPKVSPWSPPGRVDVHPPASHIFPEVSPWSPADGRGVIPPDSEPVWDLPKGSAVHYSTDTIPLDSSTHSKPRPRGRSSTSTALVIPPPGPNIAPPVEHTDDRETISSANNWVDPATVVFLFISSFYLLRYMLYIL